MNKIIAIAIDDYGDSEISNLKNCSNDINAIIDILSQKYQFEDIELLAKPEQTTLAFLYESLYTELVINTSELDSVLILFAGHGEYNNKLKTNYWLCSNSIRSDVTTWFNVNNLLDFLSCSQAKHIAIISDSCFSGAIFELDRGGGLIALENKYSRQALTSGGIEKVSDGDYNSPFNKSLVNVLKENTSDLLSFYDLSERTILTFSPSQRQTPIFGSLANSGDEGGSFFFKLKKNDSTIVKAIQLPLDINNRVKVSTRVEIPFFNENKYFNNNYINSFVQQLGYSIINDIRLFMTEDEDYLITRSNDSEGFYLQVNYKIKTLNDKFLSIIISREEDFGSAHPNHWLYSMNFALQPERKINLNDILDHDGYSNLKEYLIEMIKIYGIPEYKEILQEYTTSEYIYGLDFSFDSIEFIIYFVNVLPHAFKACGFLQIPIVKVKFKI